MMEVCCHVVKLAVKEWKVIVGALVVLAHGFEWLLIGFLLKDSKTWL